MAVATYCPETDQFHHMTKTKRPRSNRVELRSVRILDKKIGSGGGGMPDSNVRWLVNQRAPLPKLLAREIYLYRLHQAISMPAGDREGHNIIV